jgi:hypothetical protein
VSTSRSEVHVTAVAPPGCAAPGCGHPRTLHSNGTTPCRARGCKGGPDGKPCQCFTVGAVEPELIAS